MDTSFLSYPMLEPPHQQQNIPLSASHLFQTFFLCSNYSAVIFLYDGTTVDVAHSIFESVQPPAHPWITINVDNDIDNNRTYDQIDIDSRLFIITVFDSDKYIDKFIDAHLHYRFRDSFSRFIIWPTAITQSKCLQKAAELMFHYDDLNLVNVAMISWTNNDSLNVYRLMSDSMTTVAMSTVDESWPTISMLNCAKLHNELFYDKELDLIGATRYAYTMIDPPRGINLTKFNAQTKQDQFHMGGRNAYLSSLIASYLNITLKLFAIPFGNNEQGNIFFHEYFERTYVEDTRTPRELAYDLVPMKSIQRFSVA